MRFVKHRLRGFRLPMAAARNPRWLALGRSFFCPLREQKKPAFPRAPVQPTLNQAFVRVPGGNSNDIDVGVRTSADTNSLFLLNNLSESAGADLFNLPERKKGQGPNFPIPFLL
jgi:hypothetical protein